MNINNSIMSKLGQNGLGVLNDINKALKKLEGDMIILAENQMEFEKYLKDILKEVKEK